MSEHSRYFVRAPHAEENIRWASVSLVFQTTAGQQYMQSLRDMWRANSIPIGRRPVLKAHCKWFDWDFIPFASHGRQLANKNNGHCLPGLPCTPRATLNQQRYVGFKSPPYAGSVLLFTPSFLRISDPHTPTQPAGGMLLLPAESGGEEADHSSREPSLVD